MKIGELKGKAVVGIEDARRLGTVDDVFVDPAGWRIAGLRIKPAGGGSDQVVSGENVERIGRDAVTVATTDALRPIDRERDLTGLPSLNAMMNSTVVTEGGEMLGTISGVELDADARKVQAFEYGGGGLANLFGRQHHLEPENIVGIGSRLVTVREAARPSREAGA